MPDAPSTLAEKLAAVMGELDRLPKTGKHPQGWMYTPVEAVADAVRAGLAKQGVVMLPETFTYSEEDSGARTSNKGIIWRHTVQITWRICDGRQHYLVPMGGQALDHSDKGMNKAITACRKSALIAAFQLSTGDDPDGHDPTAGAQPAAQPPRARRAAPAAPRPAMPEQAALRRAGLIELLGNAGITEPLADVIARMDDPPKSAAALADDAVWERVLEHIAAECDNAQDPASAPPETDSQEATDA